MTWTESVRTALGMIRVQKLRAFFTVLGTVVGVTFLIAVITLITGVDSYIKRDLAAKVVGFNTVKLRQTPLFSSGSSAKARRELRARPPLTVADAEWLAERMRTPGTLSYSSALQLPVRGPGNEALKNVTVTLASPAYFRVRDLELATGRAFTLQEDERRVPVAVVGSDVAEALFDGRSPDERTIRIRGIPYRVVGMLEKQGSFFGMSMDNVVIVPASTALGRAATPHSTVQEIEFRVPETAQLDEARSEMAGWMRTRHRLRPGAPDDFDVGTSEGSLSFWNKISGIMMVAFPGLVGISLLVGAVVIMNIMLVSVTERTHEIGVRKSLGARSKDIMAQFLIEAGTLAGAGGVLGIGCGILLAAAVAALSPLPAQVAPWSVGAGLALAIGVGLAAGVYPAYRAARLDPVDALRQE